MRRVARCPLPVARAARMLRAWAASSQRPGNGPRVTGHVLVIALVVAYLAPDAFACSVCYGNPSDPLVKGANNGILFLLGIIGFVQIGFVAMFWSFWRKARAQRRFRESLHVIEGGSRS